MKTALITGITGQDGSYLAELLLDKGYEVHGLIRRSSSFNTARIDHLKPHEPESRLKLHFGDLTDGVGIATLLDSIQPTEIYNLGAQSHVKVSFETPVYTAQTIAIGTLQLLEAMRLVCPQTRFYQASSSEMFGGTWEKPGEALDENSRFWPRSPYAAAKVMAHHCAIQYRAAYNLHLSCGILFNHESPRRGETFVTRKITRAVGRIKAGIQGKLVLGNLNAVRDWGFAGDYARAMWMMLQRDVPDDYVVATGECHSVEDFARRAFGRAGLEYEGHVEIDMERYGRPLEVNRLLGDPSRANEGLGWHPLTTFYGLVEMMVDADVLLAKKEAAADAVI